LGGGARSESFFLERTAPREIHIEPVLSRKKGGLWEEYPGRNEEPQGGEIRITLGFHKRQRIQGPEEQEKPLKRMMSNSPVRWKIGCNTKDTRNKRGKQSIVDLG